MILHPAGGTDGSSSRQGRGCAAPSPALTVENHVVVLEIFPLLVPLGVFMQHHAHGLPGEGRKRGIKHGIFGKNELVTKYRQPP